MKSVSIIAIALFAFVALCSSVPVLDQQAAAEAQARIDIYNDFLAGLFSGLVQTTFGTVSNFVNQLIAENPLGVGKREIVESRINPLTFLYDNILQDLFSGLVTNTFGTISGALNNLIQTNPLGIGKRDTEAELLARFDIYNDLLAGLFSGLVQTTFGTVSNFVNQLIAENPLGVGKREIDESRINPLTFLYDNILQDLFSGLVTNTFSTISGALNNLIQTNPLGLGKRDVEGDLAARVDILSFLYDNILQDLFSGLVTNTFGTISGALNNLIQTNPLGLGKRSINVQQIQSIAAETVSTLIQRFKTFSQQAAAAFNDRQKLGELVKNVIADIKATIAHFAKQLSAIIPGAIANEVSQTLAALQSVLVFWTSGLGGSLGPVIGPFRP